MITIIAFVVLAGASALARALATSHINPAEGLPWGTLAVNGTGSFLLGWAVALSGPASTLVGVAALGAFTTFSTFSVEVVRLFTQDRWAEAGAYVAMSTLGCTALAWAGLALAG